MMDNFKRSFYARKAKTQFEKSLLKATFNGDFDPPKDKHVQKVRGALQGKDSEVSPEQAFSALTSLLSRSQWAETLKTELILHRSLEDSGNWYAARVSEWDFSLESFCDNSERGSAHSALIKEYILYIKSSAFNRARKDSIYVIPQSRRNDAISALPPEILIREAGYLLNQLSSLVHLHPSCMQALRNYSLKVTQKVTYWVLKDAEWLYRTLAIVLDRMAAKFNQFPHDLAQAGLRLVENFQENTSLLTQFFEIVSYLPSNDLKKTKAIKLPPQMIENMQNHVKRSEIPNDIRQEEIDNQEQLLREIQIKQNMEKIRQAERHRQEMEEEKERELIKQREIALDREREWEKERQMMKERELLILKEKALIEQKQQNLALQSNPQYPIQFPTNVHPQYMNQANQPMAYFPPVQNWNTPNQNPMNPQWTNTQTNPPSNPQRRSSYNNDPSTLDLL